MLKILIPTIMLIPTTWLTKPKWLWTVSVIHSLMIASLSLTLFHYPSETMQLASKYSTIDQLSAPLMILTCWLTPLMMLASQNHMNNNTISCQQTYISMFISLHITLILAFSATELMLFYITFEATLIPTLIIYLFILFI